MIRKLYLAFQSGGIKGVLKKAYNKVFPKFSLDEVDIVSEVLLNKQKDFSKGSGIMIDVGGHHGTSMRKFARHSWQIYAFEPDEDNRKILSSFAKKYSNVSIDPRGCSNKNKKGVPFYTSPESSGISGFSKFVDTHRVTNKVDLITLKDYIAEKEIPHVDFLKIDTEGFDFFVIQGFPFSTHSPSVVVCEFEDKKTLPLGYSKDELAKYLSEEGYRVIISEWHPIIRYGIEHQWKDYYEFGTKETAEKGWGNIVACKDELFGPICQEFDRAKELYKKSHKS